MENKPRKTDRRQKATFVNSILIWKSHIAFVLVIGLLLGYCGAFTIQKEYDRTKFVMNSEITKQAEIIKLQKQITKLKGDTK